MAAAGLNGKVTLTNGRGGSVPWSVRFDRMFVDRLVSRNYLDEPAVATAWRLVPANEAVRSESANHAASRAEGSQHMRDTL